MAQVNGTSLLGRTRSTRAPTNASKPVQASARSGGPPGVVSSSSASTAASTAAHATASPTAPSNISLFLTNLRLLDLDLRPDWPDINAHTFSAKDAAQGQKKRIQSVEWALYHLFALLDPDEARSKLQPFFPPLDHVQSLNLRAALLRALEQAKKSGVLGRDAVVRKTMLDECKGERLEEVLAVLSSVVLKKVVAERQWNGGGHPALAQTLALENRGYSGDRTELAALILAHRVSLRRTLDEKNAARARFREFSDVLAGKEKAIARRREQAERARQRATGTSISDAQREAICRMVRNNWAGDERWMETLLYGDSKSHKDGVLSAPFDRVWRRVQSGRLAELDETSAGLLEQLEGRVRDQQARLAKWQDFRQKMFGKSGSEPAARQAKPEAKQKGLDLGFRAHEDLHLGRMGSRKLPGAASSQLDSHYEALIKSLESELAAIDSRRPPVPSFFQRPQQPESPPARTAGDPKPEPEEISDISDLEEAQPMPRYSPTRRDPIRVLEEPAFEPVLRKAKTFDEEHGYAEDAPVTPSRLRRSATLQSYSPSATRREGQGSPARSPPRKPNSASKRRPRPPPPDHAPQSPPRLVAASPEPPPSPDRAVSPTQQLADQILASVSATTPSPVKKPRHTLSLAERTRLSMARRTSHANLRVAADEVGADYYDNDTVHNNHEDDPEVDRLPLKRAPVTVPVVAEPPQAAESATCGGSSSEAAGYEDLVSRTRRSMAGSEAARQKAQLERRRSLRRAREAPPKTPAQKRGSGYFPAVDEEGEGNSALLLAEELMSGEHKDDYEAVFMSRPKLKTSPVGTPSREFWGD
ncbi:uncharacterized protein THITE_2114710 [Thermothielavioides terrestris NRRL 8126]|uniref:HAUS augmin-like complex subunit 6 N-terminal domain-containing protein n=1 Tax=Thermothielavioides terrestris (strain ATCC 38088 / NRRL 8126) TaxID=578455 RepID=G2R1L9_THETT|nr:uncharacterized protein THITE_2114710 [Thermothielavioides terrestris NRRL 8126]AEO66561.1 hypothetical protein THITE_2114710 [Thermothielavioides terrestris NRRL 8126]